ncbi:MAG: hypothetical protein DME19_04575 [Verrucomicrobia bacterium]|nr:MAG: hypothetical protein DME19_04575 [Verrucomicrobiota bacterium]
MARFAAVNAPGSAIHPPARTDAPVERFLDYNHSLACIHCGLCLASCPTYLETGNENDSPRGRIYLMRAVQDGRLPLGDTAVRHMDLCLGCRACEAVCPSGVPYGELLEHARHHIAKHYRRSVFATLLRRVAIEKVFPFPRRMKLALLPVKVLRALRAEKLLPRFARDALSLVPDDATQVELPEFSPAPASSRGRVGFVSGCVMSVLFGETNANSVRLLNRAGWEVVTPPTQVCDQSRLHSANSGGFEKGGREHRSLRAARSGRHHHQRRRLRLHAQGVWAVASRRPGVGGARKKVQRQGQGPHRGPCRR